VSHDQGVKRRTRIWWGLRRRCPRCGAPAFDNYFGMKEDCRQCGIHFEREEGYWVGALIINTTVTFATFLVIFVSGILITWPDVPWTVVGVVTIVANGLIPVVFYPISKSLWLALEMGWHPLEPQEVEAASRRSNLRLEA
jgi:uncharacterized protein (DUF983 family)